MIVRINRRCSFLPLLLLLFAKLFTQTHEHIQRINRPTVSLLLSFVAVAQASCSLFAMTQRLLCLFYFLCLLHCEFTIAFSLNNTTLNIKWNLCECIRSAFINLIDVILVNWPMLGRLIYDDTVNPC